MKCGQCDSRATQGIQDTETGAVLALCINCMLKWEQAETLRFARSASAANRLAASLQNSLGIPVPRYEIPRVPLPAGNVTMNNIRIGGDLLGVLNTGSVETIDNSVTSIRNAGNEQLAAQLATFVETVAKSKELSESQRREVVELLSLVSSESTAPAAERKSSAMLRVMADISTIVAGGATVASQWDKLLPLLAGLFAG